MQHPHKCVKCGNIFQCAAPEMEMENWDGIPDVICLAYHEEGQDWCDDCLSQMVVDLAHDEWWRGIGSEVLDGKT